MTPEKVPLTDVSATLLMTLYSRAIESRTADPLLRDPSAERAVNILDYDFSCLNIRQFAMVGCAARARQFDEWTTYFLRKHPHAVVLHLACGLDSRIERVNPPPSCSWFDIDYPEVIDLRQHLFPPRGSYTTIRGSVTEPHWLDDLPVDRPVLIVAEGLTMHLHQDDVRTLISVILDRFQEGELIFDVLNWSAVRAINRRHLKNTAGVTVTWGINNVREIASWDPRLALVQAVPTCHVPGIQDKLSLRMRILTKIPAVLNSSRLLRFSFGAHESNIDALGALNKQLIRRTPHRQAERTASS
jgi:O-methyltransferase involved in polyketide biosynthesis